MPAIISWLTEHSALIFGVLFGISEALSFIPAIAANGVFQSIFNFLKGKVKP